MGDLVKEIRLDEGEATTVSRNIPRREGFRSTAIFLPKYFGPARKKSATRLRNRRALSGGLAEKSIFDRLSVKFR